MRVVGIDHVRGVAHALVGLAFLLAGCGQTNRDSTEPTLPPVERTLPPAEPCSFSQHQISDGERRVDDVATGLAWNGNGYGVVWQADASIPGISSAVAGHFALLDRDGHRLAGEDREVSSQTTGLSLAFAGDGYGLSSGTGSSVELALLDANGAASGAPQSLQSSTRTPLTSVVFGDDGFGVAWDRGFFAKVDLSGQKGEISAGGQYPSDQPRVVFTGDGYAIAWPDEDSDSSGKLSSAIYFASFHSDGTPLVTRARVSPSYDSPQTVARPELLWSGDSFALAWTEVAWTSSTIRFRAHFVRFDRAGQALTSVLSWPGRIAGMTATGNEAAVLYFNDEGSPTQLSLARLDLAGARRVQDPIVTLLAPSQHLLSAVVMNDGAYTFTWVGSEGSSNSNQLYFGRALCP